MSTKCDLIAAQGRLIVEVIENESTTSAGLVLAAPENSEIHFGKVVSVGLRPAENHTDCQEYQEGQVVVWQQYSGVNYRHNGKDYKILNQKDIIATR
jgi:chaperonin GroES